jgi:CDP-diacylglycerol--glycerol-3-phosphate 3-phosphatidyltransferase
MANLITSLRLVLLFVLVALVYQAPADWQLLNAPLLLLIIALDGLDGYVARLRGEASAFGATYDIAADRVVENVLWVVLADLDLVPLWVAVVFIVRGSIVDAVRHAAMSRGETAFGMMRSRLGRFLVASRFMRGFYGAMKAATFGWVLLLQPWPRLAPDLWVNWVETAGVVTAALVYVTVALCLLRGVPVLAESALALLARPRARPQMRPPEAMAKMRLGKFRFTSLRGAGGSSVAPGGGGLAS